MHNFDVCLLFEWSFAEVSNIERLSSRKCNEIVFTKVSLTAFLCSVFYLDTSYSSFDFFKSSKVQLILRLDSVIIIFLIYNSVS